MTEEEWPDPKKWYYDELSGEFFKITDTLPNGNAVHTMTPYQKRWQDWYNSYKFTKAMKIVFIVLCLISVICLPFGVGGQVAAFLIGFLWALPFGILWFTFARNTAWAEKQVGPKPRRRPVDASVHQQPTARPTREAADYSGKMS